MPACRGCRPSPGAPGPPQEPLARVEETTTKRRRDRGPKPAVGRNVVRPDAIVVGDRIRLGLGVRGGSMPRRLECCEGGGNGEVINTWLE
eukprot:5356389-Lingulodinium_polyedra.AAC.1